jgi:hypothetical protein
LRRAETPRLEESQSKKQKNPKVKWILNQTGIIVEPFESFEETFEERPPEEQIKTTETYRRPR